MKLARIVLGSALLPACVTLLGCSSTPGGDDAAGTAGAASAGRPAGNGGSGTGSSGGAGNGPSFGGAGSVPNGTAGYSSGGAGSGPSGTAGFSFGGAGPVGGAGGRSGGLAGAGGRSGGAAGSTGASGAAGAPPVGAVDCTATPAPLTGGTVHTSKNDGKTLPNKLAWTIWSNGNSAGSITTYDTTPAFGATWSDSGDFLARLGLQWNATQTYDQLGTITAELNYKKTGTGGNYSYVGIYGWSVSPVSSGTSSMIPSARCR